MNFPIANPFKTDGVYVYKYADDESWGVTKENDGTYKPYKRGLFSKLMEVVTTKKLSQAYAVIVIVKDSDYGHLEKNGTSSLTSLKAINETVTGELFGIINSYDKQWRYADSASNLTFIRQGHYESFWEIERKQMKTPGKIRLSNNGNTILYTAIDMLGKEYTHEYIFMQSKR